MSFKSMVRADDSEIYQHYMGRIDPSASLPEWLPPSMSSELPPLPKPEKKVVRAPANVSVRWPYAYFVKELDRVRFATAELDNTVVLNPWTLWNALDAKQRRVEAPTSSIPKAIKRVHGPLEVRFGAPRSITTCPEGDPLDSLDETLYLHRGVVCCLGSESTRFSSCLSSCGGYAGSIPFLVAAGVFALVRGNIRKPDELVKRIWLYPNADGTELVVGRRSYGPWHRTELVDALMRVERLTGMKVIGTFNGETGTLLGLSRGQSLPKFRTRSFKGLPCWKSPYLDGMRLGNNSSGEMYMTPEAFYPISSLSALMTAKKPSNGTPTYLMPDEFYDVPRVLKVALKRTKPYEEWFSVTEQSHRGAAFSPPSGFRFRGTGLFSHVYPEMRLYGEPVVAFGRGSLEEADSRQIVHFMFEKNHAEALNLARQKVCALIAAYNTEPTANPVEMEGY